MSKEGRVVTANLPDEVVSRLDDIAARIDRSKSWIVREAVVEWLAEEQRRHEFTLEAMRSMDEGQSFTQDEVEEHLASCRKTRSRSARAA